MWNGRATAEHVELVKTQIKVPISQGEFDALSSMAFNLGGGNFKTSSVVYMLDNDTETMQNYDSLEESIKWWRLADGKVNRNQMRRRADEWRIISRGVYERTYENY